MANGNRYIDQNRHIIGGNIMKLRKRIAALGAAIVMAVSMMSIGASASDPSNWNVQAGLYRPTSTWKTASHGTVTGLSTSTDNGITFVATSYSFDSSLAEVEGKIDNTYIADSVAHLNKYKLTDTAYFKANWFYLNGNSGTVHYTVTAKHFGVSGEDRMSGYAY